MSDQKSGAFWRGLLFGGLIGAAFGAALTAQADPETKQRLQTTVKELTERSRDVATKSRDLTLDLLEQAGAQANNLLERVQDALTQETAALQEAIHAGVQAGRAEVDHLQEKISVKAPGEKETN